ncbi:ArsR family transcriptional regulator [Leptospira ognonensis]|uniref:ArsR family transcriptional regulator n=1 Tax=Leptospira ognonensis TaxID=2484945 RepID=A0A4R9JWF5_9LEPT|nr:metalloregulator ArsR/SmtB family transcription factor [Leptospira ognonensis]TGL56364.1 ArsR family transcriptional regulator [Leptospira ognonensis]
MAQNKKAEFAPEIQILAEFHRVLAHPARLAILETLAERQSCICGEIVDVLPLAQATVSQHLKELKDVGIVKGEIEGKTSCYCIDWEKWEELEKAMLSSFEKIHQYKENFKKGCC